MSTVKTNNANKRMLILANSGRRLFHTSDLALLWDIKNQNTLNTTTKRYVQSGLLSRVQRGLYALGDISDISPIVLGASAIHDYAYLSTESVLAQSGIILQNLSYYTFVSAKSLRFKIGDHNYYSRQLKDEYLYNKIGIYKKDGVNIATPERAVADILYFNKNYYFDNSSQIDWEAVKKIQKNINYK